MKLNVENLALKSIPCRFCRVPKETLVMTGSNMVISKRFNCEATLIALQLVVAMISRQALISGYHSESKINDMNR